MRVMVGMSGGVDSAVVALLLKRQGHEVVGVFMKNWEEQDEDGICTSQQDFDDVRRTCDKLDIAYYTVNFSKEYLDKVFSIFLHEYQSGRTPNPDVLCNTEIKFKAFLEYAMKTDFDMLATGHYARTETQNGMVKLLKSTDLNKDQTYFLCGLNQQQLKKAMFPVGGMKKSEVRELARKEGLPVAEKKDSTGICFIGERRFSEFISKYLAPKIGDIIDIDTQEKVGKHDGLYKYTIGQRKGLGIGGRGTGEPWFVANKDVKNNILYVCQGESNKALYSEGLVTESFNWILCSPPSDKFDCLAKFRYRQKDIRTKVKIADDKVFLYFEEPQRAVTPGQYAVLYDGNVCLGGGVIASAIQNNRK